MFVGNVNTTVGYLEKKKRKKKTVHALRSELRYYIALFLVANVNIDDDYHNRTIRIGWYYHIRLYRRTVYVNLGLGVRRRDGRRDGGKWEFMTGRKVFPDGRWLGKLYRFSYRCNIITPRSVWICGKDVYNSDFKSFQISVRVRAIFNTFPCESLNLWTCQRIILQNRTRIPKRYAGDTTEQSVLTPTRDYFRQHHTHGVLTKYNFKSRNLLMKNRWPLLTTDDHVAINLTKL